MKNYDKKTNKPNVSRRSAWTSSNHWLGVKLQANCLLIKPYQSSHETEHTRHGHSVFLYMIIPDTAHRATSSSSLVVYPKQYRISVFNTDWRGDNKTVHTHTHARARARTHTHTHKSARALTHTVEQLSMLIKLWTDILIKKLNKLDFLLGTIRAKRRH